MEEGEAVAKWQRAQLSYTQLATYLVGAFEQDDMRAAAEQKLGAGAAAAFSVRSAAALLLSIRR